MSDLGLLFLCFFLSGASALVYEVVWLRWLVHLFGATTLAVSTVLTAFMGGLALGSWLAGRWVRRLARPLHAYGLLELAIGIYALALPAGLAAVVPALRLLGAGEASSYVALSLARFALAAALLVVPTACMGATLPLLAQFAAPRLDASGSRVGRLYAANTAGAVLGTAAAGLLLLPALGAAATNRLAVAINVAVGLTAIWLGRGVETGRDQTAPVPPAAADAGEAPPRRAVLAALAAIAVSGAIAMIYEVAWTRALALVLGSSVYAFTIMLATFLIGLAGGSYLLARRVDRLADPGFALALVQLGAGLAAFGGLVLLQELPYLFVRFWGWTDGRHTLLLALEFLLSGSLMLVPALLSGAVFPLSVRLTAGSAGAIGRTVGNLYAVNTVGAIVGSFVGGFLLLPAIGIRGALLLAVLLNLACAFGLVAIVPGPRGARARALLAAIPVLALLVPWLAPEWRALTMSSGVAVYAPRFQGLSRDAFEARRQRARLLFYQEGLTTTVAVEESRGLVYLRVNGKMDASSGIDMPTQILAGHLPLLLHPAPQDALVIGLGSGVSIGSALRHPLRAVTVVELEPSVVKAAGFFDHVNGRPLADPRVRLVLNDARNFLLLGDERFDVIISEPSNPWVTGAASLFTREFFELARTRLRPGGTFGQWVQLYSLTPDTMGAVIASFAAVFPYTVVFQTTESDTVLVGSAAPLRGNFAALARRAGMPGVAEDLERAGVREVADLAARVVLDVEDLPRFVRGMTLNTDDNAYVEFTTPRTLYVNAIAENVQRLTDSFAGGGSLLTSLIGGAPDGFAAGVAALMLKSGQPRQAEALALAALRGRPSADLLTAAARAAAERGEAGEAERRWRAAIDRDPGHPGALLDLARHLEARGAAGEARGLARRAEPRAAVDAALVEAALDYRAGAYREADVRLARLPAERADVARLAGLTRLALGDPAGAERLLRKALARGDDARARAALAAALDQLGRPFEGRQERRGAVLLDEEKGRRLARQSRLRLSAGHLRWAEHDIRRATELVPWNVEWLEIHARLLERLGDRPAAIAAWEGLLRIVPQHAPALIEVAALWEAEGNAERASDALGRYIAVEPNPLLQDRARAVLRAVKGRSATP
jgi:spermidine synthase